MRAEKKDAESLTTMVKKLWPEHSIEALNEIMTRYICYEESAAFYQTSEGMPIAVALCCLRHDYVEGCDTSPVAYLEGVYVKEQFRMIGIAASLCAECEDWAREMGCTEFASDCELTNDVSLQFHLKTGFIEENRLICFKKMLYDER